MIKPFQAVDGFVELRSEFVLTARCGEDQLRTGLNAKRHRIIGRGIAGVQRDDDIGGLGGRLSGFRRLEREAGEPKFACQSVAKLDEIAAHLDARHAAIAFQRRGEMIIKRKRQIAFAGADIDDRKRQSFRLLLFLSAARRRFR